jgi:DNA-binding NarL/FixJ family response regulator
MPRRVLVVDDHPIARQALTRLLERNGMDVVGEAWDGATAHVLVRELRADVVVLGFTRPLANCLAVTREILRTVPRTGVILVAFEDYLASQVFRAGVRGFVLKTRVVEDLSPAVRAVAAGGTYLSPDVRVGLREACLAAIDRLPSRT